MSTPGAFSPDEFATLANVQFFELKQDATARVRASFETLRDRLKPRLPAEGWRCAGPVDVEQGSLVAAEDYLGLPYVVLDFPKHLSRAEFLAMRTLFWWGHYVVYALILKGPWLPQAVERLCDELPALAAAGVEMTAADTPWDWRRGNAWSRPLLDDGATRDRLRAAPFIKLMRFLPLEPARFTPAAIVATGEASWKLYAPIALRDGADH